MGPIGPKRNPLSEASGNLPVILRAKDSPESAINRDAIIYAIGELMYDFSSFPHITFMLEKFKNYLLLAYL
jgi:hypothetical protein